MKRFRLLDKMNGERALGTAMEKILW